MKIRIVFLQDPGSTAPPREEVVDVGKQPTPIGSHYSCKVRIDHSSIRLQHANLRLQDGKLTILDISGRGILVNGISRNGERSEVKSGDTVKIGEISFTITIEEVVNLVTNDAIVEEAPATPRAAPADPMGTAVTMVPGRFPPADPVAPAPRAPFPDPRVVRSDDADPAAVGEATSIRTAGPTMRSATVIVDSLPAPPPAATSPTVVTPHRTVSARLWKRIKISWSFTDGGNIFFYLLVGFVALLLVKCGDFIVNDEYKAPAPPPTQIVASEDAATAPKPTRKRVCKPACEMRSDCKSIKRWEYPISRVERNERGEYDCWHLHSIPQNPDGLTENRETCLWCWME
ncbi:MAG: FHA domain-containing protein [Candidatus Uhrbacteria bacterium]|nr:FHA domain-containing protein [Candidatus Uhrbacteria bacterium]